MSAAPIPRVRIPMDQAFQEVAAHVRNSLESLNIRWTPEAEQAAICTLLIQAGRSGWLLPWNPPYTGAIPINRPSEPGKMGAQAILRPQEDVSVQPKPQAHLEPPSAKSDGVIVQAFRQIQNQIDPHDYRLLLSWYGAEKPEDFRPEEIHKAVACFGAMKRIRDQKPKSPDPSSFEHFEQTEEGWR